MPTHARTLTVLLAALSFVVPASAHDGLHEAIASFDARIERAPDDVGLLLARGDLHRRHQAWGAAFEDALRVRQLSPDDDACLLLRAMLHADLDWAETALPLLDAYLARQADDLDARWLRGEVRSRLGDIDGALLDWDTVIAARERPSPDEYVARADLLATIGSESLALALSGLDEGIARLGAPAALQLRAIDLEVERGETDAALARLTTLEARSERRERWLAQRGDILMRSGRTREALVAFRDAAAAIDALAARHRKTQAVRDLADHVARRLAELEA